MHSAPRRPFRSHTVSLTLAATLFSACADEPTSSTSLVPDKPVLATDGLGTWSIKAPIPTLRGGMAGAVIQNASGQYLFYTIGGGTGSNSPMRRVEAYNAATDKWYRKANLPVDRAFASAATINGKIYLVGGVNLTNTITKKLYVHDPVSNIWTEKASLPEGSIHGISGVIGGKLYLYTSPVLHSTSQRLYRYNPTTNEWVRRANPPHNHNGGIGGVINGKLYIAWGHSDATDVYDPVTNSWSTAIAETPDCYGDDLIDCSIHDAGSAVLRNQLYSIGGGQDDEIIGTGAYDPITNLWGRKAPTRYERDGRPLAGAVRNAAGQPRIVVVGGQDDFGAITVTEMYAP